MIKFLKKPWKTPFLGHFGHIFPIFGPLNFFFKNPALSGTTSHWSLPTYPFLKKSNDGIPRKSPDRRMDGQKERLDWFYRTPSAIGNTNYSIRSISGTFMEPKKKVPLNEFSTYLIFLESGTFTNNKSETGKRNIRKDCTSNYVQSIHFFRE